MHIHSERGGYELCHPASSLQLQHKLQSRHLRTGAHLRGTYQLGQMYRVAGRDRKKHTAKHYENLEPHGREQGQVREDSCNTDHRGEIRKAL